MRVVLVSAVYPPEPVVSAQMGRDLARHLAEQGARVTVLCPFPSRAISAACEPSPRTGHPEVTWQEGVEVVRLPSFAAPQSRLLARARESFSFAWHACRYLDRSGDKPNVLYANTWPLLGPVLLSRYCSQRTIPLVLHVQDLYPEAMLPRLPRLLRAMAAPALRALDRSAGSRAVQVVVISENMRRACLASRGLAPEKIASVLNWADESLYAELPTRAQACSHYGIPPERFTFLYLGNIGPVAGVEFLLQAFQFARTKDAQLVIAGEGSEKERCMEVSRKLGIAEVRFISEADAKKVPLLQSLAHVCLLPVRKGGAMSSIPSKLISYLLSARPVLATVDAESDTARCILEAGCGWVGEPENVEWLTGKLEEVASLRPEELACAGRAGRAYGLKHFSKANGVRRLAALLQAAASATL